MNSKPTLLMKFAFTRMNPRIVRNQSGFGPDRFRNIGIIAHIDAGKTTTTERMLYCSGAIRRIGNVDSGNTVTDFMPSERKRGITVQSAAVSFNWDNNCINVIDTPGHVDFTVEVERSLHVLDGAVAIFDASRGVEAQTRTVWRQANKMNVPRIAFINKMDKPTANYLATIQSMQEKLSANTLITQIPIYDKQKFCGIVDLVKLAKVQWQHDGESLECDKTRPFEGSNLWDECLHFRQALIEQLADFNDDVAEQYLSKFIDNVSEFPSSTLTKAIRNAVENNTVVPIACGSAVNNIGVQTLLDSIVEYLPSPLNRRSGSLENHQEKLVAYSFKLVHHKRYGAVTFARIYSGSMRSNTLVYNATKACQERISQIFTVFADEYKAISEASIGQIVAITGLKVSGTGDTLLENVGAEIHTFEPITVPQPVFFCTIEVESPSQLKALKHSLDIITREDPSVRVQKDADSDQTILCGMGELHLEVVIERLKKEFKIDCYIGPLQVAYREQPTVEIKKSLVYSRTILNQDHSFAMKLSVKPNDSVHDLKIITSKLAYAPEIRAAIKDGIAQSCRSGVLIGFPLIKTVIEVLSFKMTTNSPIPVISAAAVNMTRDILSEAKCCVLEPVMDIEIVTNTDKLPSVLKSLAKKRAEVVEISGDGTDRFIAAKAPVGEMLGYSTYLRSIASGDADLTLKVAGYEKISGERIKQLCDHLSGQAYQ